MSTHNPCVVPELVTVAIVDASNVARNGSKGKLSRLITMRDELMRNKMEVSCIADASLRYYIDDVKKYEKMINDGIIAQAPSNTSADDFITLAARKLQSRYEWLFVVTNDSKLAQDVQYFVRIIKFIFLPIKDKELLVLLPPLEDMSPKYGAKA